jgi:hypothetical protein
MWRGRFWVSGNDQSTTGHGVLKVEPGVAPTLEVAPALTAQKFETETIPNSAGGISYKATPSAIVHPVTIHGAAEDGTPLTVLEAHESRRSGHLVIQEHQEQQFLGIQVIVGVLTDSQQGFPAFRLLVQGSARRLSMQQQAHVGATIDARLVPAEDGTVWLDWQSSGPRSVRMWDQTVSKPVLTLLELAEGSPVEVVAAQVGDGERWFPVLAKSHEPDAPPPVQGTLLQAGDLTIEHVVAWIDAAERLGPVAPVVVDAMRNKTTLETQVLTLASVAEGVHRRLHPSEVRMPVETARTIAEAAVIAATAIDPKAAEAVNGLLGHLDDLGYRQRLAGLAKDVSTVAGEVTGRTSKWKALVYDARNDFAHRVVPGWLTDDDIDRYVCVALSLRWLLRIRLLQVAEVQDELLRARLRASIEYQLFLEQAADWCPAVFKSHDA